MIIHKYTSAAAALLVAATPAASQVFRCSSGPGSVYGIVGYQCANCGYKHENGQRAVYTFFAEPVVSQVDNSTAVANGDVIEAVDGLPITTQAGAEKFTYPGSGEHTLTVRRGRDRQEIKISLKTACYTTTTSSTATTTTTNTSPGMWSYGYGPLYRTLPFAFNDDVHRGNGSSSGSGTSSSTGGSTRSGTGRGVGIPAIGGEPLFVVDGVVQPSTRGATQTGRFGFAVECRPSCTLKRAPTGEYYNKYDGLPPIVVVREGSAADRAGLRVGDLVVKVNGRSILDDVLHESENDDTLRLTVRRDGKDIDVLLLVTK